MFNMDVINIILVIAIMGIVILSIVLLIKRLRERGKIEKADLSPLYENNFVEEETIESAAKKVQKVTKIRDEDMGKIVGALKVSTEKMEELAKKTFDDNKKLNKEKNIAKAEKTKSIEKANEKQVETEKIKDEGIER